MLNRIKSKYIIKLLFLFLKTRKKIAIVKYNKKFQFFLNIKKNDFQNYTYLNRLNEIIDSNIEDIDEESLDLRNKITNNFDNLNECLAKIDFNKLKELNLSDNKISEIKILKDVKFPNLEYLNLNLNIIEDITVLKRVDFKHLKKLYIYHNRIRFISK